MEETLQEPEHDETAAEVDMEEEAKASPQAKGRPHQKTLAL